jgi:hypothetical protein
MSAAIAANRLLKVLFVFHALRASVKRVPGSMMYEIAAGRNGLVQEGTYFSTRIVARFH